MCALLSFLGAIYKQLGLQTPLPAAPPVHSISNGFLGLGDAVGPILSPVGGFHLF
jgi:hypothetical protein